MLEIDDNKKIPATVCRADLLEALQPLCDLLNVTPNHFFEDLRIGNERITLLAPVPESVEDWCSDRPKGRKGVNVGGSTAWSAQLAQIVIVKVTDR